MKPNPLNAYRQTRVKTASQGQLIIMLYDECLRQLEVAERELSTENPKLDMVHNAITKSQDIITELSVSLDFDKGGDIAKNLFNLYMFFNQTLVDANMTKEIKGISQVYEMMKDLRQAWGAIESSPDQQVGEVRGGINLAG